MAPPLKDQFGTEVVAHLAALLVDADPQFPAAAFYAAAVADLPARELSGRARAVADALRQFLPDDPAAAIGLLMRSLPDQAAHARWQDLRGFALWPYTMVIADVGVACFDLAMAAQHEITKHFTAEFSIRTFLQQRPEPTLAVLAQWAMDPDEHVRRLVSEGTRPRLPWAARLPDFVADPTPVLSLLELLADDPAEYVRRSVANNLNDISKDHPQTVIDVADRWLRVQPTRRPLLRHALRTLLKAGDPAALQVLGFVAHPGLVVDRLQVLPAAARIGGPVAIDVTVTNRSTGAVPVLVDVIVGFARPNGVRDKVFRGAEFVLDPGASRSLRRSVTLAQLSTRRVYPGIHRAAVMVNGSRAASVEFDVAEQATGPSA